MPVPAMEWHVEQPRFLKLSRPTAPDSSPGVGTTGATTVAAGVAEGTAGGGDAATRGAGVGIRGEGAATVGENVCAMVVWSALVGRSAGGTAEL